MKRKTLADGFKGITGISGGMGFLGKGLPEDEDLPYVPLSGEIRIVEEHFICKFGCTTFIRHSPEQVGKLVEALLENFLSKKPEDEEE